MLAAKRAFFKLKSGRNALTLPDLQAESRFTRGQACRPSSRKAALLGANVPTLPQLLHA